MEPINLPPGDYGEFHALIIGNNEYKSLPKLKTAVNDAKAVNELLKKQYGYNTRLLTDATRGDLLTAFAKYRKSLKATDNLLIYYAGHGIVDKEGDQGYWLPVDADPDIKTNWIANSDLITELKALKAKHIIVVADSCFSGKLVRGVGRGVTSIPSKPDRSYIDKLAAKKYRYALTSGGVEPVLDSGGDGNHSVFAAEFIKILKSNDAILLGTQIFQKIREKVYNNADQLPEYAPIRKTGHDGGDFLFIKKN